MAERDDGFLSRWSRRKRDPEREPDPTVESDEAKPGRAAIPQDIPEGDEEAGDPEVIAKLPDIESLDEGSDFTPFMAEGVPEILRRRALRKLWRLNPVFAHLDGLAEYDEDFTIAANLLSEVKTVYKVGRGMVEREAPRETPRQTDESERAEEREEERPPAEPQHAESPADAPARAEARAEPPTDRIASGDTDRPVPAEASLRPPAKGGQAGETVPRTPAAPLRRSAAARRWGESSD